MSGEIVESTRQTISHWYVTSPISLDKIRAMARQAKGVNVVHQHSHGDPCPGLGLGSPCRIETAGVSDEEAEAALRDIQSRARPALPWAPPSVVIEVKPILPAQPILRELALREELDDVAEQLMNAAKAMNSRDADQIGVPPYVVVTEQVARLRRLTLELR